MSFSSPILSAVLFIAVLGGVGWWLGQREVLPISAHAPKAVETPPTNDKVDSSGKFNGTQVNEMGKESLPPVTKEAAETRLKEAMKLAETSPGKFRIGEVEIDAKSRTIMFPAKLEMCEGLLEYALVHESGKTHETLLVTKVPPQDVHIGALLLSGVSQKPTVEVMWRTNGPPKRVTMQELVSVKLPEGDVSLAGGIWSYGGSQFSGTTFAAQAEGSMISLIPDGNSLASLTETSFERRDDIFSPNAAQLPPKGVPLTIILTFPAL